VVDFGIVQSASSVNHAVNSRRQDRHRMTIILAWVLLAIVVGIAANSRGRSGAAWFFLAVIVSPLISGLLVLALPNRKPEQEREAELWVSRKCPHCAEWIKREATICRHCHSAVEPLPPRRRPSPIGVSEVVAGVLIVVGLLIWWMVAKEPEKPVEATLEAPPAPTIRELPPVAAPQPKQAAKEKAKSPGQPLRIAPQ
jgi:hypothetical protein